MWHREYRDYPLDSPLVHQSVEPNNGIVGCEMHEINGWGTTLHTYAKRPKRGFFSRIYHALFGKKEKNEGHKSE